MTLIKPMRAWNGRLKNIDELLSWLYSQDILTESDKKKKDTVFRQYYRYYNDGDMPRALTRRGLSKYDSKKKIEEALEVYLEEFIKSILVKYKTKIDRKKFRIHEQLKELNNLKKFTLGTDGETQLYQSYSTLKFWSEHIRRSNLPDGFKYTLAKIKKIEDQINQIIGNTSNRYIEVELSEMSEGDLSKIDSSLLQKRKELYKLLSMIVDFVIKENEIANR